LQPNCGNVGLTGEIEPCEFQWETRDLRQKLVEVTFVASEVEGGEVGESLEEARGKKAC